MKAIARSYFWWPKLDQAIEQVARSCTTCQAIRQAPASAPLHPWTWPSRPWQRVHIDFAGPFLGKMFFLAIDAHSKWGEVIEMSSTTALKTIEVLHSLFAAHGLPEQIVSDNGPQFVAEEFQQFMQENRIRHIRCAPYHPASNGLVERFVRTFKEAMKAGRNDNFTLKHRLANFLFLYRTTPQASTQQPPCVLFLGRPLCTRFDLLHPDLTRKVEEKQAKQKNQHDQHAKPRQFKVGQAVLAKNMRPGDAWIPGVIVKQSGPVSYQVDVGEGRVWKRHLDHLRARDLPDPEPDPINSQNTSMDLAAPAQPLAPRDLATPADPGPGAEGTSPSSVSPPDPPPPSDRRYPQRDRQQFHPYQHVSHVSC